MVAFAPNATRSPARCDILKADGSLSVGKDEPCVVRCDESGLQRMPAVWVGVGVEE
jgi:hypothetical protein